jgi:hypothetical protein
VLRIGMTPDGLVAVDLDPASAYDGLSPEFGDLPPTWTQQTPRGGRHYPASSAALDEKTKSFRMHPRL